MTVCQYLVDGEALGTNSSSSKVKAFDLCLSNSEQVWGISLISTDDFRQEIT